MKYQHLVSLALAAALLAGCGGTESNAGSAAVGQSTGSVQNAESSQNTPALTAQKERVTDQFALEKNALSVWEDGAVQHFSVHVPKLECTSPDAVSLFCADPHLYCQQRHRTGLLPCPRNRKRPGMGCVQRRIAV